MTVFRFKRNFFDRPPGERDMLLHLTWCDDCDVGGFELEQPEEWEEAGQVYLLGRCPHCKREHVTEIMKAPGHPH